MQKTVKKPGERTSKSKDRAEEETVPNSSTRTQDEKLKRTNDATPRPSNVTPRNYVLKSTAADIYNQTKKKPTVNPLKAPKKPMNKTSALSKSSPMKDQLRPSPTNSTPQRKPTTPVVKKRPTVTPVDLAKSNTSIGPINVTVNSPPAKRKLHLSDAEDKDVPDAVPVTRQRQKTRTLKEDEVKILTSEAVDNNTEMLKLSKSLKAQPKAFFVDLGGGDKRERKKPSPKSSEDEVSYEDDFESYESDFESYHSGSETARDSDDAGKNSHSVGTSSDEADNVGNSDDLVRNSDDLVRYTDDLAKNSNGMISSDDAEQKDYDSNEDRSRRDEEKMLDSGSYDLRDSQKSAGRARAVLEHIQEDREAGPYAALPDGTSRALRDGTYRTQPEEGGSKGSSLTDEGFQEMGNAGGTSLTRVEVLERPLFIDFTKSKETKRKRRISERLRRRAADLLSMITLHEMSYSLFEMKPIPYDLYMATFGRSNHVQSAAQTYDDGVDEEVQTDEVLLSQKWTQYPVRFSDKDVYLSECVERKNHLKIDEDYLKKFTFLLNTKEVPKGGISVSKVYLSNPLRIYFEQNNGVGTDSMLPLEEYEAKLKNTSYSVARLKKFLKKVEGRLTNILAKNAGNAFGESEKPSVLPFSKGYTNLEYKNLPHLDYLKHRNLTDLVFSDTKSNLLMTVHRRTEQQLSTERDLICLWDVNVASGKPLKILVAIDNITLCRFRGSTDGIFVSALEDGSIHLWDLSEEATILKDVASSEDSPPLEVKTEGLTKTEIDRDLNAKDSSTNVELASPMLQACAYTTSAANLVGTETADYIVGLELLGNDHRANSQDGGRKLLGQVCSLQRIGVLTIWMIIQEKECLERDLGKAFWSRIKLEKNQGISLSEYVDLPTQDRMDYNFNLTAAKRRILAKKLEKKHDNRPKSSPSTRSERPDSAANVKNQKPTANLAKNKMADKWESGILCTDLKVCKYNKIDHYLVGKSCGEVLLCTRLSGAVKVNRFLVTNERSTITALGVSQGLPYFLAASDAGTVVLCSLLEARALLTLDCRNICTAEHSSPSVKYHNDLKGRYIGTVPVKPDPAGTGTGHGDFTRCPITSLLWPAHNPCCIAAAAASGGCCWQLARSDIYAAPAAGWSRSTLSGNTVALLTSEGEVQIHRLRTPSTDHREIFLKYVALL